jgi:hypothetical protein
LRTHVSNMGMNSADNRRNRRTNKLDIMSHHLHLCASADAQDRQRRPRVKTKSEDQKT